MVKIGTSPPPRNMKTLTIMFIVFLIALIAHDFVVSNVLENHNKRLNCLEMGQLVHPGALMIYVGDDFCAPTNNTEV